MNINAHSGGVTMDVSDNIILDASGSILVSTTGDKGELQLTSSRDNSGSILINAPSGGLAIQTNKPTIYSNTEDATCTASGTDPSGSVILHGGMFVQKTVISVGGFDNLSDRRLKTNIKQFNDALPIIKKIRPVTFN